MLRANGKENGKYDIIGLYKDSLEVLGFRVLRTPTRDEP